MISAIDHFVISVRSLDATCEFYAKVLGLERVNTPGAPTAMQFGQHRINVHEVGHTFDPKAEVPTPGSADFCLITDESIEQFILHLQKCGVAHEVGPVRRAGARGAMTSVYFRDPDANLVEVATY